MTHNQIKQALAGCKPGRCAPDCPYGDRIGCVQELHQDTLAMIQQLEAQVPKWICVEERLPEDQRSVLTVNGHGEIRIMGLWSKHGDAWTWVHNDRMMHYNDITHWMPLPEPPKEG